MKARRIYSVPFEIVPQKSKFSRRIIARLVLVGVALALAGSHSLFAQDSNEMNKVKEQLRQMQENFDRVQREQRDQIDALKKQLDDLTKEKAAEAEKKKLADQLAAELGTTNQPATAPAASVAPAGQSVASWSPAQPFTIARAGSAYMNIS